jgi:hypothetical protein
MEGREGKGREAMYLYVRCERVELVDDVVCSERVELDVHVVL